MRITTQINVTIERDSPASALNTFAEICVPLGVTIFFTFFYTSPMLQLIRCNYL